VVFYLERYKREGRHLGQRLLVLFRGHRLRTKAVQVCSPDLLAGMRKPSLIHQGSSIAFQ